MISDKSKIGIRGFPHEIVSLILTRQKEQTGKADITMFDKTKSAGMEQGGFTWEDTVEGHRFWHDIIMRQMFDIFYKKYTKVAEGIENKEMTIGLDHENKIVTLSGKVNLEEFIREIANQVPNWEDWKITTTVEVIQYGTIEKQDTEQDIGDIELGRPTIGTITLNSVTSTSIISDHLPF